MDIQLYALLLGVSVLAFVLIIAITLLIVEFIKNMKHDKKKETRIRGEHAP